DLPIGEMQTGFIGVVSGNLRDDGGRGDIDELHAAGAENLPTLPLDLISNLKRKQCGERHAAKLYCKRESVFACLSQSPSDMVGVSRTAPPRVRSQTEPCLTTSSFGH